MFKSLRSKLRVMLFLLALIIPLMLLNYSMSRASAKLDKTYTTLVKVSEHFVDNIASELSAIGNPFEFKNLEVRYQHLSTSCLQCHRQQPSKIIEERSSLLNQLHHNQVTGVSLRETLTRHLDTLTSSVKYIHEHHIASMKNFLSRNQLQEDAYPGDTIGEKYTEVSAPELDIIQETVYIQHSLADVMRIFYMLKDSNNPIELEDEFFKHMALFYTAINDFESYSLDAQDGLLVEELLEFGRKFELSFKALIYSIEEERTLLNQLQENQQSITLTLSAISSQTKQARDQYKKYLHLIAYVSFFFTTLLILFLLWHGNAIIQTINQIVKDTNRITDDYKYRIEDTGKKEEEFQILSNALNSMAQNLDDRIVKLNKEVELRTEAERKRAETERTLQRAEQRSAIGTLAGGIAHDFNNLLTAILGNINIATYCLPPDHHVYNNLVDAEKATKRAHKLTNQLLTFSKGGGPVKETASIEEVIRESAFFILHGSNVDCRIDIPDNLWLATIDKGQIGQVIQNLTLNADNAMPDGGTITIRCRNFTADEHSTILPKGEYVQVSIKDQGIGIAEQDIPKIFTPYFTTREKGSTKGNGLGLAIVDSIISRHGGHIEVETSFGEGTTFTFYLPASSANAHKQEEINGDILFGEGRILVMDDESMILEVMKRSLPSIGYSVETADSGEQALQMFDEAAKRGQPFSLVIMDLTIPGGMGGKETAERLLAQYPDAILLVSSGYAEDPIMTDPEAYGFKGALQKPYALRELSHLLHKLLTPTITGTTPT